MEVKKDGIFLCVTSSHEEIREHLRSIAEIKQKRELKQAKKFLKEKGIRIHNGHKKMVEVVYNEIIGGRSNYPVQQQAELLVEADRIGVWERQLANPDLNMKISPKTNKLCKAAKSPYRRFIELCERLDNWREEVKEAAIRPIDHGQHEPLDIDGLSRNLLTQLHVGCQQWVKDYKEDGEGSQSLEKKKLFDRAKDLAK
ncbi:hypothetical protein QBC32DRAFT_377004 [Pseudoneurospora amorphoporcata]|uniref:Uncharacterized protein n=1 Tax=Pseudoneurospora amorphoporcata TaxID=241081 RepID=A0AAN6SJH6_9PEZI|nr:hypothetical protein QBC32DRAFT_377004 [Pseudoneurospora amorphoporcata]